MIHLVRSEWVKFRSVRSTIVTLLLAGVLVVLVGVLTANSVNDDLSTTCEPMSAEQLATTTTTTAPELGPGEEGMFFDTGYCGEGSVEHVEPATIHLTEITGGVVFATLLFGILGVQVVGQEYRFNTIRPTFTAAPHRYRVMAAKVIVVCTACAAIATAMVAFCWLVGTVMVDHFEVDGVDQRAAWGIVLFSALWTAAGVGVGAIVRQPIAAILILVAESLVLESILGAVITSTQKWLPFANGVQMTFRANGEVEGFQSVLNGGIYFAAFCAALVVIGAILVQRRDA